MLQVKSFKFSEDDKINELLLNYRLAAGAGMFVSEGQIIISYEDGEPINAQQQIIDYKVQINEMNREIGVILHSNQVINDMIVDLLQKKGGVEVELKGNPHIKKDQALVKEYENQIESNHAQLRSNDYELRRLRRNIELFEIEIKKLSA